jgi:hypothetical protein
MFEAKSEGVQGEEKYIKDLEVRLEGAKRKLESKNK